MRIRTVDGLRGFAALLVVFDHTVEDHWGLGPWSTQNHGVVLFAILTGMLVGAPFLRARLDGRPEPALRPYLRARASRIYPGYWVALAGAALLVGWHYVEQPATDWLQIVTLTQAYGPDGPWEGIPPTWSLSMFFAFYLLLPVWSRLRRRADRDRDPAPAAVLRRESLWLAGVIVGALLVRELSLTGPLTEEPVFNVFGRADWFAIGMLLAIVVAARQRGLAGPLLDLPGRRPWPTIALALAATTTAALLPLSYVEGRDQLDTIAATLLIAALLLHGDALRGPQRWCVTRPAQALGRWSYGIFLWGWIVQKALVVHAPDLPLGARLPLTMALAVLAGAASWRFVEAPLGRRLKRRATGGDRPADPSVRQPPALPA
ncbi:acyltransferase family protein [Conexibacter sp. W3-3-2]|uniref:acyltransferase family protein n=1 Tax=Conexibacter sp. W3-3-2 TaxID=2675227 RepID=UPI0012B96DBD|nr:acyltransferase [Conexibacter sp. W3-3-2]MTD44515.1 acyltransferase family protein [Conexibacter sp. W3-3-2]